jgi:hypothetical protein
LVSLRLSAMRWKRSAASRTLCTSSRTVWGPAAVPVS